MIQRTISKIAWKGEKKAPLATTKPLTMAKMIGTPMKGLYGRGKSGSLFRKMTSPSTVRKKNVYSPRPLKVRRARKLPKRIYNDERMVDSTRALLKVS